MHGALAQDPRTSSSCALGGRKGDSKYSKRGQCTPYIFLFSILSQARCGRSIKLRGRETPSTRGWGKLSLPFFFLCPPTAWPGRQTSLQEVPGRAGQQRPCLLAREPEKGGPGLGKHQGDCRHLRTFRNCWAHPWAGRRALTPNSPSQTLRTELQDGH